MISLLMSNSSRKPAIPQQSTGEQGFHPHPQGRPVETPTPDISEQFHEGPTSQVPPKAPVCLLWSWASTITWIQVNKRGGGRQAAFMVPAEPSGDLSLHPTSINEREQNGGTVKRNKQS